MVKLRNEMEVHILRSCPFCGSEKISNELVAHEKSFGKGGNFTYGICSKCGSMYLEDISYNLNLYYDNEEYYSFKNSKSILWEFVVKHSFKGRGFFFRFLRHFMIVNQYFLSLSKVAASKEAKILDVGSGTGTNLKYMINLGFKNVFGIDPYIDNEIDHPFFVWKKRLSELDPSLKFDIIIYSHSLEHIDNPREELIQAKSRLSSNGIIVVILPTVSHYFLKEFQENWVSIEAPRHLSIPSFFGFAILSFLTDLKIVYYESTSEPVNFFISRRFKRSKTIPKSKTLGIVNTFLNPRFYYYRHLSRKLTESNDGEVSIFFLS